MPSSPNYKRDYSQEYSTAKKRGEDVDGKLRKRDRRLMVKNGLVKPGQDVDHKHALNMGGRAGTGSVANLRAVSVHDNRSFPRNRNGSMKNNT